MQLEEAKRQTSDAITRLKEVETELTGTRTRCEHQAADLLKKSSMYNILLICSSLYRI